VFDEENLFEEWCIYMVFIRLEVVYICLLHYDLPHIS